MKIACSAALIAGAALLAGSTGAIAAPASGGAIKAAADQVGIGESVHCRPFRHWHRWGWGHGCRGPGVTIYERGPRFRHRFGVREEFRGGFRTRERAGVTIRGEERTRSGATFRSGTHEGGARGSATTRGGGGQAGASTNATGGQQMKTAPTGQTTGGQQRGVHQRGGGEQKQQ